MPLPKRKENSDCCESASVSELRMCSITHKSRPRANNGTGEKKGERAPDTSTIRRKTEVLSERARVLIVAVRRAPPDLHRSRGSSGDGRCGQLGAVHRFTASSQSARKTARPTPYANMTLHFCAVRPEFTSSLRRQGRHPPHPPARLGNFQLRLKYSDDKCSFVAIPRQIKKTFPSAMKLRPNGNLELRLNKLT